MIEIMRLHRLIEAAGRLRGDTKGVAATEFAFIVPIMLVLFFGMVELSSGIAANRKVTLVARSLSDLASQSPSVSDADIANFFAASGLIMWPYASAPIEAKITEVYIKPTTLKASVQWSKGAGALQAGDPLTIPAALAVADTYLIVSEVKYRYVPTVAYIMNSAGVVLTDTSYTRPRQSACVPYAPLSDCTTKY